ncbi:hypothetical protein DFH29DRAFT_1009072 [Suillus ampliporus]|nr:hypothetical protein DFH29DRAFT_1009072 [Suillus ampliporus]
MPPNEMSQDDANGTKNSRPKRGNNATYRPSGRSIPDLLSDPVLSSQVTNENTARSELEKHFLITPATEITMDSLITALLDFTIQTPSLSVMCIDIIRAVAILLLKTDHEMKTNKIATAVIDLISDSINRLENTLSKKDLNTELENANVVATIARAEDAADGVLSSVEEIKNIVNLLTPSLDSVQTHLNTFATKTSSSTPAEHPQSLEPVRSYSSVVKQSTSQTAPVSAALIRAATRERQVLFDPAPGHTLFPPEDTPIDIANKVSQALQTVRKDNDLEIEIKASQRLRNGGVVIELTTSLAAQWARAPANHQTIIEALGLQAQIKNRTFPIIVPFLPISSPIDNREWINEVEMKTKCHQTRSST